MKAYPAHIWKEENNTYSVEFPDLPGCFSCGESLEHAKEMAMEALNGYLGSLDSRKLSIPEPSAAAGEDIYLIQPNLSVSFAITLKQEREKQGLTQREVAKRLGVNWSAYQRIENPRRTNPTLATIEKLQSVFGTTFFSLR
jgi:antitoxin HicB